MFTEDLADALALIGIVIVVASLLSGVIERSGLPQVGIFLILGALLGPFGLGLVTLTLESPTLQAIATLALVLVLFSDAIAVDMGDVKRQRRISFLVLGPGTLIPAVIVALAGRLLLGLTWLESAIIGAALASTDPVLLRNLLRRPSLPATARVALRLESGMNDVVLLPIVVLGILVVKSDGAVDPVEFGRHAVGLFLLGPLLGAFIGWIAIMLLEQVRARVGVRRDYESLYALGVAFTAFAAAEAVGGSGFLAAFAAGLMVAALDVELCDCFLDYGQATAEMFLLFTFVAFGAWLIWTGFEVADAPHAAVRVRSRCSRGPRCCCRCCSESGIRPARPPAHRLVRPARAQLAAADPAAGVRRDAGQRAPVPDHVSRGAALGVSARRRHRRFSPEGRRAGSGAGAITACAPRLRQRRRLPDAPVPERITIAEMQQLQQAGAPVIVADVSTDRSYNDDPMQARGALRLPPDDAVRRARQLGLDHHGTVVLYCA